MSDKNMADVADKVVDKVEALVQAMAKVAPEVWETMVRAERIAGVTRVVTWVLLLGVAYVAYRVTKWRVEQWKGLYGDEAESALLYDAGAFFGAAIGVSLIVACVVTLFVSGGSVAQQILVPEYAAGMRLLEAAR